jgi:hypothetical protein
MPIGGIYDPLSLPPPPSWNGNYIGSHAVWNSIAANQSAWMFWQALRERCFAANVSTFVVGGVGGNKAPEMPVSGDLALGGLKGYEAARSLLVTQAQFYVRRYQLDGTTDYWPEGLLWIDSAIAGVTGTLGAPVSAALPFPAPAKFSRRFHRIIFDLANPGAAGERVKFIYFGAGIGERYHGVKTTESNFDSAVISPSAQRQHDGKYFERVAGAWVLSADQISDPMIVDEDNVLSRYRGDLHDAKLANELRDAYNQLARTIGYTPGGGSLIGSRLSIGQPSFRGSLDQIDAYNTSRSSGTDTVSAAHADAAYTADAIHHFGGAQASSNKQHDHWVFGDGLPHRWTVSTNETRFVIPSHPTLDEMPNPLNQSRNIHYFIVTDALNEWDDQGIPDLIQDVWHEYGTSATGSTATSITGPFIGDTASHPPNWPTAPVGGDGQRGWALAYACMVLDWETSGGFQFSKLSP